jgi:DNA-binding response OmpR family regulator
MTQTMTPTAHAILLVEDDLSLRGSLCQFLNDHGYHTLTAGTARHGWEMISQQRPALCLLDLNLPDGSGLDLLRRIAQGGLPTRVIVMTAFDLKHLRPAGIEGTLVAWMTKPINPIDLLAVVEEVMRQHLADHREESSGE